MCKTIYVLWLNLRANCGTILLKIQIVRCFFPKDEHKMNGTFAPAMIRNGDLTWGKWAAPLLNWAAPNCFLCFPMCTGIMESSQAASSLSLAIPPESSKEGNSQSPCGCAPAAPWPRTSSARTRASGSGTSCPGGFASAATQREEPVSEATTAVTQHKVCSAMILKWPTLPHPMGRCWRWIK